MQELPDKIDPLNGKKKIKALLDQLNHGLVEREDTLKAALLAVLAGQNLILVGPPGTAKSLVARRIAQTLAPEGGSSDYFEYLLTKFSTPEEIFGPLSIAELKADRVKRNTTGYLPSVRIAFLDEIFKASSSILNALLTILNERIYHNGAEPQHVPLQALIAASNELPHGQEELAALYDRFLVRVFVDYVSPDNLSRLLEKTPEMPELTKLSGVDLAAIRKAAELVSVPPSIVQAILRIWQDHKDAFKEDRREALSDRRLKQVLKLLCVSAATNGRTELDLSDVILLKGCLWNHPENDQKVREIIFGVVRTVCATLPQVQGQVADAEPVIDELEASDIAAVQDSVLKGYRGSGTESDPIRISDVHDLVGLEREEVGLQGYHFRQTCDIDCTGITPWLTIDLKGHYDGGGHCIDFGSEAIGYFLDHLHPSSSMRRVRLIGKSFASKAESCSIEGCSTDRSLVHEAKSCQIVACDADINIVVNAGNCQIVACDAKEHLINSAVNCTINRCRSGRELISNEAIACDINDCVVIFESIQSSYISGVGGIAGGLKQGSRIARCLISGTYARNWVDCFAVACEDSSILSSAFAAKDLDANIGESTFITRAVRGQSTLRDNIVLRQKGEIDGGGKGGKSISPVLFQQRYFENTLGWDFTSTWQWDDAQGRPTLRSVGVDATVDIGRRESINAPMADMLAQQMRANIWL
jgi:MoxR-like ATPase